MRRRTALAGALAAYGLLCLLALGFAGCGGDSEQSVEAVFDKVGGSVVFIYADGGSGSGIVFDERGHIVTSYHVIEDAEKVRVTPPGSEAVDAEVVGFDRQADVAVLLAKDGVPAEPLPRGSDAETRLGSRAIIVGYPLEGGTEEPVLQVSAGVVSALRVPPGGNIRVVQTDAALNPGNSGGAIVNAEGELIAVASFTITPFEGAPVSFGVSVGSVEEVAQELISSGRRELPLGESGSVFEDVFEYVLDSRGYRLRLEAGETISVTAASDGDIMLSLVDPFGIEVAVADDVDAAGRESIAFEVVDEGLYTLAVVGFEDNVRFSLEAGVELQAFVESEDGRVVRPGDSIAGELQYAGDRDTYLLDLADGEEATVTLRSWDFDALVWIISPDELEEAEFDDDSGQGILATDAKLEFQATGSATHQVVVQAVTLDSEAGPAVQRGFYTLSVEES